MTVLCLAAVTATRDKAERAVRDGEARKSAMLNAALDSVITADHDGRIVEFNRAAEQTFGYALEDVRGKELSELIIPERLREDHRRALGRYVTTGRSHLPERRMETVALRADGSEFPVELTVTRIELEGSPWFTAFVRDITDRKSAERRLIFLAEHDPLTGLINRRRFDAELARQIELAARYGQPGSLVVMDVDNLKHVNDAFGHAVGDQLLRKVAETLRGHLRSSDIVARLGGDEFVALLPSVDEHQALAAAEHLLSSVRSNVLRQDGQDVRATLSIGVCGIRGERTSEQLLVDADRAMYRAKQLGRDRVTRYGALELELAEGSS